MPLDMGDRAADNVTTAPDETISQPTRPPSRRGKHMIAGYFPEEVYLQFKEMAAQQRMTTDQAVAKALYLLFKNYNQKPPPQLIERLKRCGLTSPTSEKPKKHALD